MKKSKIVILATILIIVLLNSKTISLIKNKVNNSEVKINKIKEISLGYKSNISFLKYRQGFLVYDGKSLNYINSNAERIFSLNVRMDNYSIDTDNSNIYLLDRMNKEAYIVDKKGTLIKKIRIKEKPIIIKALKNNSFLIHYSTNVEVEGVKIYDINGNEIKDISIPKITINLVETDLNTGAFLISGNTVENDSLYNNIFYYNKKGELMYSDKIENKVFVKTIFVDDNIDLIDPTEVEIRDREFNVLNKINLDENVKYVNLINDYITIIDDSGNLIYIDQTGNKKIIKCPVKNVQGIKQIGKEKIIYSDRSIYFTKYKKIYDFSKDIVDVLSLDDKNLIVVFRGSIEFLNIN
ncbi:DUF5711 family protein [Tepidibacter thalassicus]|uniref:Uncharacterized protein n=1 Tax=Tepidibacter thalassicus DSM 15285 TaxID=1123350 RepID=A0A1M5RX68_9FIRM|nr:DUF5711 family protein [Tepidibacter thalassicus]SHH30779.1 hypothetical protein SAMN02744040_01551 [Tepidibacter thalassicus DSM 15285]